MDRIVRLDTRRETALQRIADRFHAIGAIPRSVRVSDIVWTPPATATKTQNNG